jgi:hypothetical protein
MGLIDNTKKALRLLLGRRYTSDDLNIQQEAFTSTLDIRSADVYTEDYLIPALGYPSVAVLKIKKLKTELLSTGIDKNLLNLIWILMFGSF